VGLAHEIQKKYGVQPVLHEGRGGVFDVAIDGELVFSKYERGRFPEEKEILDELEP
jgi:selT/selW/selH-like putative selenoprotein